MKLKRFLSVFLMIFALVAVVGCNNNSNGNGGGGNGGGGDDPKPEQNPVYTYRTYTTLSPSNWNELTYQDNNDTQIMNYLGTNFFQFNFKFDANGKPISGDFVVEYAAATSLRDVTKDYAGNAKWGIPEGEESGRAYVITLRKDLKWEDGTAIKAEDFVYTMSEQLNPLFKNYRADSYYNSGQVIHNAENYVKQGSYDYSYMISAAFGADEYINKADFVKSADGTLQVVQDGITKDVVLNINSGGNWSTSNSITDYYKAYIDPAEFGDGFEKIKAAADEEGYVKLTEEYVETLRNMVAIFHGATLEEYEAADPDYAQKEWQEFCFYGYVFPEVKFENVGIFVGDNEYELVIVLDKTLELLEADGSLGYKAAYNMANLPLVHRVKYEANKIAPTSGNTLWTSSYNSSVSTTMSWGPYRLQSFESGKQYILVRNENWYGYGLDEYKGQYQTDRIICDTIPEWNGAWVAFQAGEIDSIGIDVSIAEDYKGSKRAIFTPDDYVGSLQLQSNKEALKERERDGINKTILSYTDFRKALSLSIDRAEYVRKCTTSSLAGFGLFNSMHYYDVAHGGVYRNEDVAKEVLCKVYGVNVSDYRTLDEAYASITGYNMELAKELVNKAYDEALAAGDIKEGDVVEFQFGTSVSNDAVIRNTTFLQASWLELVKGTKLDGKLQFAPLLEAGKAWADDFRAGNYDICQGGWSGAAWDPGYFLLAYLSPQYMYSKAWDTSSVMMEFTMPGVAADGGDVTDTMSLMAWYNCLNGVTGAKYNWAQGRLEESKRLLLIGALEEQILTAYYTVPISYYFSASLLSYKVEYITRDYNTFMAYGGVRYMTYNYSDAKWAEQVKAAGGQINYK